VKIPSLKMTLSYPKMSLEMRDKILEPVEFDHMNSEFCMAITLSKKL